MRIARLNSPQVFTGLVFWVIISLCYLYFCCYACGPCQIGKQVKSKHPSVASVQTSRPLELLHIDLMGPARVQSLGEKKYILVVVDDFTRYT